MPSLELIADDLAPGDARAAGLDWSGLRLERIRAPGHRLFDRAYERLWKEFGEQGEMEKRDVIASRLAWDPCHPANEQALLYEMLAVTAGDEIVALRDHTAIVPKDATRVVVHLSHVLVEPSLRGSGLAGW